MYLREEAARDETQSAYARGLTTNSGLGRLNRRDTKEQHFMELTLRLQNEVNIFIGDKIKKEIGINPIIVIIKCRYLSI